MTDLAFSGVHHVSLPVTDLAASIRWYETCLAAERVIPFDHHDKSGAVFAVVLRLPGHGPMVELRVEPAVAAAIPGFMPVAFAVRDPEELGRWIDHFEAHGIAHSPKTTRRVGESVDVESPDGLVLRFYTDPVGGFESVEFAER